MQLESAVGASAPVAILRGIEPARAQGMPGVATASEAFSAIRAGATQLKLFPAASYGPRHLQALRVVLPSRVRVFPVGGVGAADIPTWLAAGAAGFGVGCELFPPQYDLAETNGAHAKSCRRCRQSCTHSR